MAISSVLGSSALLPAGLGFRNVLINGNFDIWQRGTSTFSNVSSGSFSSDRAYNSYSGTSVNMNVSRDTGVPDVRSKYSIKYQQLTSNATSVTEYAYRQYIEGTNAVGLYGRTVVLSFWYKSNKTGSHGVRIYGAYATGGVDFTTTFTVSAADTWEYKTITTASAFGSITANPVSPTDPGALVAVGFCTASGVGFSSITANDYFQISQIQLEANRQPTPFEQRPIGVELALCQRYYEDSVTTSSTIGANVGLGGNTYCAPTFFKVTKRIQPTSINGANDTSGNIGVWNNVGAAGSVSYYQGGWTNVHTSMTFDWYGTWGFALTTTGGLTDADLVAFRYAYSAEL